MAKTANESGQMIFQRKKIAKKVFNINNSKIIFIIYEKLTIGGVQRKIADVCQYLFENDEWKKHLVYLLLDDKPSEEWEKAPFLEQARKSSVHILTKPQSRFRIACPFFFFALFKTIMLHPVAMLAFYRHFAIIAVAVKCSLWWRKLRVVISDDTYPSLSLLSDERNRCKRFIISGLVHMLYSKADLVISPSHAAQRDLIKTFHLSAERLVVNTNWTLLHPVSGRHPVWYDFIYAGRVSREKNLLFLFKVISKLCETLPEIKVCIVGGGDEFPYIKRYIEENQMDANIFFAGIQRTVDPYYKASKVFCLSSNYEGLPIAALEAMAYGLPVLTTGYPGAEELVRDGETGFICRNIQEYVARSIELLTDHALRKKMGEKARTIVKKFHGKENLEKFVRDSTGRSL